MVEPDAGRWDEVDRDRAENEPWSVLYDEPDESRRARTAELDARPGYSVAATALLAEEARIVASTFSIGAFSYVAAGCLVRGEVVVGTNASLNAGVTTIGRVRIGDGVRIASGTKLVGENHGIDDLSTPIWLQPLTSLGVVVGDDVWIGANVVVVDGVTVGDHSVVAAGAVVTHDVPAWSVAGGVPARVLRDRRAGTAAARSDRLSAFATAVAAQWPQVLARCRFDRDAGDGVEATYVDRPGAGWGPRPLDDAIEIAAAFGEVCPVTSREELVERLQASQDPATGMFVDPNQGAATDPLAADDLTREWDMYGILSVGYALEVLGSGPRHPIRLIEDCAPGDLERRLDALDLGWMAWPSGSWIDAWGTAVHLNRRHHGSTDDASMLFGWLATHQRAASGLWGDHLDPAGGMDPGWLMAVNGFYRLTRGTYAQFGLDVPRPERAIDTVLAHCAANEWFHREQRTACNVLDVVHPLWLLGRQTVHRRDEVRAGVAGVLTSILDEWVDGEGFAFEPGTPPGLQGTEMWLAIAYLAADVVGESAGLPWRPRGVHRLEPGSLLR